MSRSRSCCSAHDRDYLLIVIAPSGGTDGRMVAYLGCLPYDSVTCSLCHVDYSRPDSALGSSAVPGALGGPTVDVGEFPHIFFPLPDVCRRAARSRFVTTSPASGFELVDLRRTGTLAAPHPAGTGGPPGQPTRPGHHGRRLRGDQPVPRAIPGIQRRMVGPRYVLEVSSPGIERPLRWPEHWRRFVGRRARVRARPLGRRRVVEIVAVPDDEHVTAPASTTGEEVTLGLDDDQRARRWSRWTGAAARSRAARRARPIPWSNDTWQVRPRCWPRSAS